jgi:hypothetical protein
VVLAAKCGVFVLETLDKPLVLNLKGLTLDLKLAGFIDSEAAKALLNDTQRVKGRGRDRGAPSTVSNAQVEDHAKGPTRYPPTAWGLGSPLLP